MPPYRQLTWKLPELSDACCHSVPSLLNGRCLPAPASPPVKLPSERKQQSAEEHHPCTRNAGHQWGVEGATAAASSKSTPSSGQQDKTNTNTNLPDAANTAITMPTQGLVPVWAVLVMALSCTEALPEPSLDGEALALCARATFEALPGKSWRTPSVKLAQLWRPAIAVTWVWLFCLLCVQVANKAHGEQACKRPSKQVPA